MEKIFLLSQLAATLALAGIIWLVQIVHYPLFRLIGAERYAEFHQSHMNLISFVVAPLMIVEAATAVGLIFYSPSGFFGWLGAALVLVVWASTFFVQVPLHEKLARGFDSQTHLALVKTNWIRTIAWTARAGIVLWFAGQALK